MVLSLIRNKISGYTGSDLVRWMFYIYIFSLVYLSGMSVGNIISKAIGVLYLLSFIIFEIILSKKKMLFLNEMVFIGIWYLITLVSGFFVKDQILFINRFGTISQLIILFIFGTSTVIYNKIKIEKILILIIIGTMFIFIQGMYFQSSSSLLYGDTRLQSSQGNPNTIANFGIYSLIFCAYFLLSSKKKTEKVFFLIVILFFIYGLLETESRKGIIAIPLIICIFFLLNSIKNYKITDNKTLYIIKYSLLIIGLIIVFYLAYKMFISSAYFKRFQRLLVFIQTQSATHEQALKKIIDYSTYERRQFIKCGIEMWLDHFWFGVGLDNFKATVNEYWLTSKHYYSHNNYVELLSTTGLLGFISYYSIYGVIIRRLLLLLKKNLDKRESLLINSFIVSFVVLLLIEMVIVSYYLKFFWLLLMIMSSYPYLLLEKYKNSHTSNKEYDIV